MECVNDNRRCWSAEISRIDPELGKHKKKSFNFSRQQQNKKQKKKKKKNEGVNIDNAAWVALEPVAKHSCFSTFLPYDFTRKRN